MSATSVQEPPAKKEPVPIIGPRLAQLAKDLAAGEIGPITAAHAIEALAEGTTAYELRMIEVDRTARQAFLISIGMSMALEKLENALPRRVCPADGTEVDDVQR